MIYADILSGSQNGYIHKICSGDQRNARRIHRYICTISAARLIWLLFGFYCTVD